MNRIEKLEQNMIDWDMAPEEARKVAQEISAEGALTGIAVHPQSGRVYVICTDEPMDTSFIVWEEEAQCEFCCGSIDDGALGSYRCTGGQPDFTIGFPRFCSECTEDFDCTEDLVN